MNRSRVECWASHLLACCFALVAMTSGCSEDTGGRLPLKGNVSFEGEPLERGTIEFVSADGGEQTGGVIKNGKFDIPAEHGLNPGEYTVRISSIEEGGNASADLPPGPDARDAANRERIPPEYNTNSEQEVELSAEQTTFDFDIP